MRAPSAELLDAVLIPPQRARLRAILGLPDLRSVGFVASGWHRFAVLAPDCVLLLPRSRRWVPGMEREATALKLLEQYDIAAPRLLARLHDEELWADPVTMISRYHLPSWSQLQARADRAGWTTMLAGLAELIARVHSIPVRAVPEELRSPPPVSPEPLERDLWQVQDYLRSGRLSTIACRLAVAAGFDERRADAWLRFIQPCCDLPAAFVHRDINEGQIMIDSPGRTAGLIDWESAGLQHPLNDLDFSTWGPGIWELETEHDQLRRSFWEHYAVARGVDLPDWPAIQLFMIIIGAPPPEGRTTAWTPARRERTFANLRAIDALV